MTDGENSDAPKLVTPHEVWVIDSCSIIEVRRDKVRRADRPRIWSGLTKLVQAGSLLFPSEVYKELERGNSTAANNDEPFEWAKKVRVIATRCGTDYAAVEKALQKVPEVLDHNKVSGADEADPYVLALALRLKEEGHEVTVVTEEIRDRPDKTSLNTACGLLRLYSLSLIPFLGDRNIWTPP